MKVVLINIFNFFFQVKHCATSMYKSKFYKKKKKFLTIFQNFGYKMLIITNERLFNLNA